MKLTLTQSYLKQSDDEVTVGGFSLSKRERKEIVNTFGLSVNVFWYAGFNVTVTNIDKMKGPWEEHVKSILYPFSIFAAIWCIKVHKETGEEHDTSNDITNFKTGAQGKTQYVHAKQGNS
jgi:hypothetical protein